MITSPLPRLSHYTEAVEVSRACRDAVRFVQCLAHSHLDGGTPAEMFAKRYPESGYIDAVRRAEARHRKGAVVAATPGDAVWASPLMPPSMGQSLVTFSDQFSVTGRLRLVTAPFNVRMPAETDPLTGGTWFGNGGAPLVVLSGAFEAASHEPLGIGGIVVITAELARATDSRAEAFLQRLLGRALAEYLDAQFCDPSVAAVEHLNPASVTNSATPIASAGSSLEAAKADLRGLIAAYKAAGARLERAALLMSSENASYLRLTGDPAFAELTTAGGRVAGIETFASDAVGTRVILADQGRIVFADAGGVDVAIAREAALQMDSAPTQHSGTATATNLTSLWQSNAIAIRLARTVNWQALENAVQYVEGADYSGLGSPA